MQYVIENERTSSIRNEKLQDKFDPLLGVCQIQEYVLWFDKHAVSHAVKLILNFKSDRMPLHNAVRKGQVNIVKYLRTLGGIHILTIYTSIQCSQNNTIFRKTFLNLFWQVTKFELYKFDVCVCF